jgi:thiol-disulfide isomerase/thioredoxin
VAAPSSDCAAVTVDVESQKLLGYLDKGALDGLDGFDEERRKAAATELRIGSRPGAAARPVGAKPWPAAKQVFTPLAAKVPAKATPPVAVPLRWLRTSFGPVSRQALLGKTYVMQFWAGWCTPCVAQTAELRQLYQARQDRNFEIVTVSLEKSSEEVPWPAVADGGFSWTVRRLGWSACPPPWCSIRRGGLWAGPGGRGRRPVGRKTATPTGFRRETRGGRSTCSVL